MAPGSGTIITCSHDGKVIVTDIDKLHGEILYEFDDCHQGHVLCLEIITSGNYFASGGNDGRLNIYKVLYEKCHSKKYA